MTEKVMYRNIRFLQMVAFLKGALGEKAGGEGKGGGGREWKVKGREESDECWWSQLCANKHLTEHEEFQTGERI